MQTIKKAIILIATYTTLASVGSIYATPGARAPPSPDNAIDVQEIGTHTALHIDDTDRQRAFMREETDDGFSALRQRTNNTRELIGRTPHIPGRQNITSAGDQVYVSFTALGHNNDGNQYIYQYNEATQQLNLLREIKQAQTSIIRSATHNGMLYIAYIDTNDNNAIIVETYNGNTRKTLTNTNKAAHPAHLHLAVTSQGYPTIGYQKGTNRIETIHVLQYKNSNRQTLPDITHQGRINDLKADNQGNLYTSIRSSTTPGLVSSQSHAIIYVSKLAANADQRTTLLNQKESAVTPAGDGFSTGRFRDIQIIPANNSDNGLYISFQEDVAYLPTKKTTTIVMHYRNNTRSTLPKPFPNQSSLYTTLALNSNDIPHIISFLIKQNVYQIINHVVCNNGTHNAPYCNQCSANQTYNFDTDSCDIPPTTNATNHRLRTQSYNPSAIPSMPHTSNHPKHSKIATILILLGIGAFTTLLRRHINQQRKAKQLPSK